MPKLFMVHNNLQINDRLIDLYFENRETPRDNRPLPSGSIYTFGQYLQGCDIPDCLDARSWGSRMVIYSQDERFWMNLFKQKETIYYSLGKNSGFPSNPTPLPGKQPVQTSQVQLTIRGGDNGGFKIANYHLDFTPGANVKLIEIANELDFDVTFTNYEEHKDDVPRIPAQQKVPTPGQWNEGCDIPDCSAGQWWAGHRMTVTDTQTNGKQFMLNLFKITADIYYSFGNDGYPSALRPLPGGFSQCDGRKKVLVLKSVTDVEMRDQGGQLVTDKPTPPPWYAYTVANYNEGPAQTVVAGYRRASAYLNSNAQEAFTRSRFPHRSFLYAPLSNLPFQDPRSGRTTSWMTTLWDYTQTSSGPYVGLRAKWFSNVAIPETHDCLAVKTSSPDQRYISAAQDLSFRDQLFGGIRSYDMRYVNALTESNPYYIGIHFFWYPDSTMDDCVAALQEFFSSGDSAERCHEFVILKVRYETGATGVPAMRMYYTLIQKLIAAGLADRILPNGEDASGQPLSPEQLPFATMEKLNVSSSGGYKNLLITAQPEGLVKALRESAEFGSCAKYIWSNGAVESPGDTLFSGDLPQRFGLWVRGLDDNSAIVGLIDYPDRQASASLASAAVDAMLYNPDPDNAYLNGGNPANKILLSRNKYGSRYNYNFLAANFFQDTTFVSNVIQLNIFNDRTDLYTLDSDANYLSVALEENGTPLSVPLKTGTYFGSLQLAEALQGALTSATDTEFVVDFDGKFTISTKVDGAIAAVRNNSGCLEVFVVGTDHALWHRRETQPGDAWSDWSSLGGRITGRPSVGVNQDGRLEVFARGADNALHHNWQTPDAGSWSGWYSLGGALTSNPAVAANQDGRLEVFVRGTDKGLWHRRQTKPGADSWSDWTPLYGVLTSDPAVAANQDGRLEVFARGTDNALHHNWQTPDAGSWSGWYSLGGALTSNPAVAANQDGRLEVFVRGTDKGLWHRRQTKPGADSWSDWTPLYGVLTSEPAVAVNSDGRLEVFARQTDKALWHIWQWDPNSASWSGWSSLDGILTSDPVAAMNNDGGVEVFVYGTDNTMYRIWQTKPHAAPWSPWTSLGSATASRSFQLIETKLSVQLGFGSGKSKFDWKLTGDKVIFPLVHNSGAPTAESVELFTTAADSRRDIAVSPRGDVLEEDQSRSFSVVRSS